MACLVLGPPTAHLLCLYLLRGRRLNHEVSASMKGRLPPLLHHRHLILQVVKLGVDLVVVLVAAMRPLNQLGALALAVLREVQGLPPPPLYLNLHLLPDVVDIEHLDLAVQARPPLGLVLREHLAYDGELLLGGDHRLALGLLAYRVCSASLIGLYRLQLGGGRIRVL